MEFRTQKIRKSKKEHKPSLAVSKKFSGNS
jgi:hypothetical protein